MADGKLESAGADDAFVVKFAPDGRRAWAKRFGGTDVDAVYGLATTAGGEIYLAGETARELRVGAQDLPPLGAADLLVVKLGPDGAVRWARRFGSTGPDYGRAVRTTAEGGVVVLGEMSRSVDFGGGPIESNGNRDVFLLSLGPDGAYRWATHFGGTNDELALGLAIDPSGSILVTGTFDGQLELAGETLRSAGGADAFVAKLGPDGAPRWIRRFGGRESDIGAGLAVDATGNAYAVGWFWYGVDFGKGKLESAGRKDAYVVALAPDGATLWSRRFGGTENDFLQGVATGPDGGIAAIGTFHGTVAFGGAPLAARAAPGAQLPLGDVVVVGLGR
jgi:hypothetical protein